MMIFMLRSLMVLALMIIGRFIIGGGEIPHWRWALGATAIFWAGYLWLRTS